MTSLRINILKKFLIGTCISVVMFCIFFFITEAAFRYLTNSKKITGETVEYFECGEKTYYYMIPGCAGTWTRKENGKTSFSVKFTMDQNGFRNVSVQNELTNKKRDQNKKAIVFGGSSEFGWGINDDETVAALLLKLTDFSFVFNASGNAFGPFNVMRFLDEDSVKNMLNYKEGEEIYGFYFVTNTHYRKIFTDYENALSAGGKFPRYENVGDDWIYRGFWKDGGFEYNKLNLISKSELLKTLYFFTQDFNSINIEKAKKSARIFKKIQDMFFQKFNSRHFYVVVFQPQTSANMITNEIRNAGINVLDYSQHFIPYGDWSIDGDHPTANLNLKLTEMLVQKLNEKVKN